MSEKSGAARTSEGQRAGATADAGIGGSGLDATANVGGGGATSRAAAVWASDCSGPMGDGAQALSHRHRCKDFGRLDFLANGVKSALSRRNPLKIQHISRRMSMKNHINLFRTSD